MNLMVCAMQSQHRTLNQFLNKAVLSSKQHPDSASAQSPSNGVVNSSKLRIPVDYVHTRERDRFYDLPSSVLPSLPLSVRPYVNARHRMRVRVTTDQKTGEKLAQIIKVRIADLDIYSPRTAFDWRISVNLEMAYDGDVSNLTEIVENGRKSERNKDRMTYKHLAYQIDLTQVTMQAEVSDISALAMNVTIVFISLLTRQLSRHLHDPKENTSLRWKYRRGRSVSKGCWPRPVKSVSTRIWSRASWTM